MATLITKTGDETFVAPGNNKKFTLEEAQKHVGGWVELIHLNNGLVALCNEEGRILGLDVNKRATMIVKALGWAGDYLVGPVLICNDEEF